MAPFSCLQYFAQSISIASDGMSMMVGGFGTTSLYLTPGNAYYYVRYTATSNFTLEGAPYTDPW
jgi:hypothetical protein